MSQHRAALWKAGQMANAASLAAQRHNQKPSAKKNSATRLDASVALSCSQIPTRIQPAEPVTPRISMPPAAITAVITAISAMVSVPITAAIMTAPVRTAVIRRPPQRAAAHKPRRRRIDDRRGAARNTRAAAARHRPDKPDGTPMPIPTETCACAALAKPRQAPQQPETVRSFSLLFSSPRSLYTRPVTATTCIQCS